MLLPVLSLWQLWTRGMWTRGMLLWLFTGTGNDCCYICTLVAVNSFTDVTQHLEHPCLLGCSIVWINTPWHLQRRLFWKGPCGVLRESVVFMGHLESSVPRHAATTAPWHFSGHFSLLYSDSCVCLQNNVTETLLISLWALFQNNGSVFQMERTDCLLCYYHQKLLNTWGGGDFPWEKYQGNPMPSDLLRSESCWYATSQPGHRNSNTLYFKRS